MLTFKILIVIAGLGLGTRWFLERNVSRFEEKVAHLNATGAVQNLVHTSVEHKLLPQDGYDIHYYTSGEGEEAIIFLAPAFADHSVFDHQIDEFSAKYKVITIDLLGHGFSQPGNSEDKIDKSAEHIRQILEKEGYSSVHLVGVSMGSYIAQYFAFQYPQHTSSVTVIGGASIHKVFEEAASTKMKEMFNWFSRAIISIKSFRKYTATHPYTVLSEEAQARLYKANQGFSLSSFKVMPGLNAVVKDRPEVNITYPLLIMPGEKDLEVVKQLGIEWHKAVPSSEFIMVPQAAHNANMDNPVFFNNALLGFLQKNSKKLELNN